MIGRPEQESKNRSPVRSVLVVHGGAISVSLVLFRCRSGGNSSNSTSEARYVSILRRWHGQLSPVNLKPVAGFSNQGHLFIIPWLLDSHTC